MRDNLRKNVFLLIVVFLLSGGILLLSAKSFLDLGVFVFAEEDLSQKCQKYLTAGNDVCKGISQDKCQKELNECLDYYEEQSQFYEGKVSEKQTEGKTLQNQIYVLRNKIKGLDNEIYKSNLMIKDLSIQIEDTECSIEDKEQKIKEAKLRLAELLRLIEEQDRNSLVEIMLAEEHLSDFFDEMVALESLNLKNQEVLTEIKNLKTYLEEEKTNLATEKQDFEYTVAASEIQKGRSQSLKSEQEWLLKETKGEEKLYQEYLEKTEKNASEIRKRIFQLAQVGEEEAPSYEEAYQIAKYVEGVTGVRAALILGLLQVESAIGKNVGQCNCKGRSYCAHPEIGWEEVMRSNQYNAFKEIVNGLGLDIDSTPVSCSISGGKVQWGGAMGPAQFIPTTWKIYKPKIEAITGQMANPWKVRDAFLAAGLYLKDFGANSQILQKEIGAVTAYLCGTSYMTSRCQQAGGYWYRSSVIKNASQWEDWIEEGVFNGN
jgi:membrane-bound lytic murein transglycosylase B